MDAYLKPPQEAEIQSRVEGDVILGKIVEVGRAGKRGIN